MLEKTIRALKVRVSEHKLPLGIEDKGILWLHFFSSLYFKHTSADVKCIGNKRIVRFQGLETSKYFPIGNLSGY